MKKVFGLILAICMITMVGAQTNNYEFSRKVSTRGYAEKEVTPDIIYLSVSLKEYFVDGNNKKKVDIESLEKQLYNAALAIGVKKEDFTIQNVYSYNTDNKKKGNSELLQAKQYRLKISNLNGLNGMMDKVDPKGLQSTSINGYDHSQKRQIEKELKVAAVQDARANAEIIASATGDKIGKVLVINDNSSFGWNDVMPVTRAYMAKAEMASADMNNTDQGLDISIHPIKLTCNIDGVFELQ
ncbi:SIMPL domain-containing protein [Sphingobacterium sp. LRF_L2]|uniref:SIMPL domain-containing protein n=1 Tax=Sphingobacterium sp. LRF_L2 TaxID=3369421 RepID=UPI003F63A8C8